MDQRRPRRWLWPLVTVLLLAGIGAVAVWTGWLSVGQPEHNATTSPATTASSPRPSGPYAVAAGEGGTGLAADGVTHVGYDGSCQGAVQAATNYDTFVIEGQLTDRWTDEAFQAVLDQIVGFDGDDPTGLKPQLIATRDLTHTLRAPDGTPVTEGGTALLFTGTAHPERGGYLVRGCSAEGQAVVDIVSYWDEPPDSGGPIMHRVSVSWFKGDWRLVGWDELSDSPVPDNTTDMTGPNWTNPSAQYRRAWMSDSGDPWTEYTNAPR